MNGKSHGMTDAENSAESIGTKAQMGIFAQKLQRMFFGLNRVFVRIGSTQQFHLVCHEYQIEPLGFYALEKLAGHDVGFAYSTTEHCK